jgi:hypothetical protein
MSDQVNSASEQTSTRGSWLAEFAPPVPEISAPMLIAFLMLVVAVAA